jgi:sterol desaturase/sphingolipid hydroxylase (fatty acid hydroxylase superfamily)
MSEPKTYEKSGCATFFFWCLPSVLAPITTLIFINAVAIGLLLSLLLAALVGLAWAKLSISPEEKKSGTIWNRVWVRATVFTLAQCAIVPVFCYSVIYGFCAITGTGNFH